MIYAELIAAGTPKIASAPARKSWSRRVHRLLAILFTATVAASFVAFAFGPPPAWITYAPLAPLLVLMVTGWAILLAKKGAVK